MKGKIGFNLTFAILAFPIGLALYKDTDFENWTFRKPALDTVFLLTFIALLFFMFKKKEKETEK